MLHIGLLFTAPINYNHPSCNGVVIKCWGNNEDYIGSIILRRGRFYTFTSILIFCISRLKLQLIHYIEWSVYYVLSSEYRVDYITVCTFKLLFPPFLLNRLVYWMHWSYKIIKQIKSEELNEVCVCVFCMTFSYNSSWACILWNIIHW